MLIQLYRYKTPAAALSLTLTIAAFGVTLLVREQRIPPLFFYWQSALCTRLYQIEWLHYALTVALVSTTAHWLNATYNAHTFSKRSSALPGFVYALGLFSLDAFYFSPPLVGHLLLVDLFRQLLTVKKQKSAKAAVFWAGCLIGILLIAVPTHLPIILLPWLALAVFRPFIWREWLLSLIGVLLPLIHAFSIFYLTDNTAGLKKIAVEAFQISSPSHLLMAYEYVIFGLLTVIGFLKYVAIFRKESIQFKKQGMLLIHFLWLGLVVLLISWWVYHIHSHILLIPFAFFLTTAILRNTSSLLMNTLFIIWLAIGIANRILELPPS